MAVAFTAYTVDDHVENGGDGLKLGFFRFQSARVAAKRVRKSRRDEFGRLQYDGEVLREKGDIYLVDWFRRWHMPFPKVPPATTIPGYSFSKG
jgi:hypothetical protein